MRVVSARIVSAFICAAVIVASASTPADARRGIRLGGFGSTKRTYIVPVPHARSVEQSPRAVEMSYVGANGPAALTRPPPAPERRSAWEERCNPTLVSDADGFRRYRYAAPDCDLQVLTSR